MVGNVEGWASEYQGDGRDRPRTNFRNTDRLLESVVCISQDSKFMVMHPSVPLQSLLHVIAPEIASGISRQWLQGRRLQVQFLIAWWFS